MRLGLFFVRLIVGGIFVPFGYPKLFGGPGVVVSEEVARLLGAGFVEAMRFGPAGFAEGLRSLGVPQPEVMAVLVGAVEFFGGLALVFGLLTRLAALLLAGNMAVAIWLVTWPNGLIGPAGFALPLALLGGCLAPLFDGPGPISLDWLLFGGRRAGYLGPLLYEPVGGRT